MPIGRTPGFLSSGMRRPALKQTRRAGSVFSVARRLARAAMAVQRAVDGPPKEQQIRRQPSAGQKDLLILTFGAPNL